MLATVLAEKLLVSIMECEAKSMAMKLCEVWSVVWVVLFQHTRSQNRMELEN